MEVLANVKLCFRLRDDQSVRQLQGLARTPYLQPSECWFEACRCLRSQLTWLYLNQVVNQLQTGVHHCSPLQSMCNVTVTRWSLLMSGTAFHLAASRPDYQPAEEWRCCRPVHPQPPCGRSPGCGRTSGMCPRPAATAPGRSASRRSPICPAGRLL